MPGGNTRCVGEDVAVDRGVVALAVGAGDETADVGVVFPTGEHAAISAAIATARTGLTR
jgi:hypothetical protein